MKRLVRRGPTVTYPIEQSQRRISIVPVDHIQAAVILPQPQPIFRWHCQRATDDSTANSAMGHQRQLAAAVSCQQLV